MTNDLQQIIDAHKNTTRWVIVVSAIVILLLVFKLFYGHTDPTIVHDDIKVRNSMDSLKAWTKQQEGVQQYQEQRYHQDSIRLSAIGAQVNRVPAMLQGLKDKSNEKLHTIDTMSADEQFSLFSEWITSSDTL